MIVLRAVYSSTIFRYKEAVHSTRTCCMRLQRSLTSSIFRPPSCICIIDGANGMAALAAQLNRTDRLLLGTDAENKSSVVINTNHRHCVTDTMPSLLQHNGRYQRFTFCSFMLRLRNHKPSGPTAVEASYPSA